MNGESELLRSIRSSLAKMIREFDSNFYIPFWGVNEQIEEDYEDILIKLTETKEPYVGEIPVAMIEGELQGTLFEDISQENKRLKFMVDLPSKVDQISSNLTEILEMYNASDSIAYKIVKNIDIETFFDKNRLNALSRELEGVSDGIALLGAACNIADVAERAEAMNDTFLDQIAVLRDFDASKYKGASVRHIKNAAVSLIETKQKSMEAIAEETVEQTIDILGGKAADLTFTGKAVSALQTADAVLSQLSGNYANSMVSAEISYILGQSVNLEFIVLRELENMVQDMNGLNYKYTLQNAKKVRDAALLYLNLNLRDKSYIYYLNSINEENWETSEQAKDIKRKIAQIQAMRTALISTEDSDEQIVLEGFKHIYSDKPGMTREKINEDILYHEKDNTNDIQQNGQWSTPYIDYIESIRSENWSEYRLVYINDDDIPELYILGNSVAQGNRVCTIKNGRIQELDLVGDSGISYIEGENIFCDSGGWMDVYHDYVYQITDGDFILIGKGEYGAEDNANVKRDAQGRPIYQYFWNDRQVTVEEYQQTLREVFPQEQAEAAYDNMVTVEEILQQLKSRN